MLFLERLVRRENSGQAMLTYLDRIFPACKENPKVPELSDLIKQPMSVWNNRLNNPETKEETLTLLNVIKTTIDEKIVDDLMGKLMAWTDRFDDLVIDRVSLCGVELTLHYSYDRSSLYIKHPLHERVVSLDVPFVDVVPQVVRSFLEGWLDYRDAFCIDILNQADEQLKNEGTVHDLVK